MNYIAILLASIAQFIIGAVWYMPIFGKTWGKIHGFDALAPETQKEMQKSMAPLLVMQFIGTIVTTVILSIFISGLSDIWNAYVIAGLLWLGFMVPVQISGVIFGGTKPEWMLSKTLIMAGAALICTEVAALIITVLR